MSLREAPLGIKPWKVALFRFRVPPPTTKSSPDSISILPALAGLEAVAILPSVLPVLKKKGTALAGPLQARTIATTRKTSARGMTHLHGKEKGKGRVPA